MAAVPLGLILGSLDDQPAGPTGRPAAACCVRWPWPRPLALVPTLFDPPALVVAVLAGLCGFAIGAPGPGGQRRVRAGPAQRYRARAFGVVQGGLQLLQGAAVLAHRGAGPRFPVSTVVGAWSLGGVVLMIW